MKAQGDTWESARASKCRTAGRSRYRVCRDVFIADTDAEAKRMVLKTGMMRTWHEYLKEIYVKFGLFDGIIADSGQDISPADIHDDFLIHPVILCGSPETVIEKLEKQANAYGGWGK